MVMQAEEILRTTNQPETPAESQPQVDSPSYEERIDALAGAVRKANWNVLTEKDDADSV